MDNFPLTRVVRVILSFHPQEKNVEKLEELGLLKPDTTGSTNHSGHPASDFFKLFPLYYHHVHSFLGGEAQSDRCSLSSKLEENGGVSLFEASQNGCFVTHLKVCHR